MATRKDGLPDENIDNLDDNFLNEIDDKFDRDIDDDFGEFESDASPKQRTPVSSVVSNIAKAVKPNPADFELITSKVGKEYENIGSAASSTLNIVDDISRLKDDAVKDIVPAFNKFKLASRKYLRHIDKRLPPSIVEKLDAVLQTPEQYKQVTEADQRNEAIQASIAGVFAKQSELQHEQFRSDKVDAALSDKLEDIRHTESTTVLYQIRNIVKQKQLFFKNEFRPYLIKSLELKYKHLFVTKDIFKGIKSLISIIDGKLTDITLNTSLPDIQKQEMSEEFRAMLRDRLYGKVGEGFGDWYKTYAQTMVTNLKEKVFDEGGELIKTALGMGSEVAEGLVEGAEMEKEIAEMGEGGDDPGFVLQHLSKFIKSALVDTGIITTKGALGTEKFKNVDEIVGGITARLPYIIRDFVDKHTESVGSVGTVATFLKEKIIPKRTDPILTNILEENIDKAIPFDVMTRRAIVEIIPGFLAKIHKDTSSLADMLLSISETKLPPDSMAALSDKLRTKEELMYDISSEDFIRVSDFKQQTFDKLFGTKAERTAGMTNVLSDIAAMGKAAGIDDDAVKDKAAEFNVFLNNMVKHDQTLYPNILRKIYADEELTDHEQRYSNKVFENIDDPSDILDVLIPIMFDEEGSERGKHTRAVASHITDLSIKRDEFVAKLPEINITGGKRHVKDLLRDKTATEIADYQQSLVDAATKTPDDKRKYKTDRSIRQGIIDKVAIFARAGGVDVEFIRDLQADIDIEDVAEDTKPSYGYDDYKEAVDKRKAERTQSFSERTAEAATDTVRTRYGDSIADRLSSGLKMEKDEVIDDTFIGTVVPTDEQSAEDISDETGIPSRDDVQVSGPGIYIQGSEKELHIPLDKTESFWDKFKSVLTSVHTEDDTAHPRNITSEMIQAAKARIAPKKTILQRDIPQAPPKEDAPDTTTKLLKDGATNFWKSAKDALSDIVPQAPPKEDATTSVRDRIREVVEVVQEIHTKQDIVPQAPPKETILQRDIPQAPPKEDAQDTTSVRDRIKDRIREVVEVVQEINTKQDVVPQATTGADITSSDTSCPLSNILASTLRIEDILGRQFAFSIEAHSAVLGSLGQLISVQSGKVSDKPSFISRLRSKLTIPKGIFGGLTDKITAIPKGIMSAISATMSKITNPISSIAESGLAGLSTMRKLLIDKPIEALKGLKQFSVDRKAAKLRKQALDIYRKDNIELGKPLVKGKDILDGKIFTVMNKVVKSSFNITLPLMDMDGNILVSQADIDAGLVSADGKELTTMTRKILRGTAALIGKSYKKMKSAGKRVIDTAATLGKSIFKRKDKGDDKEGLLSRIFKRKDKDDKAREGLLSRIFKRRDEDKEGLLSRIFKRKESDKSAIVERLDTIIGHLEPIRTKMVGKAIREGGYIDYKRDKAKRGTLAKFTREKPEVKGGGIFKFLKDNLLMVFAVLKTKLLAGIAILTTAFTSFKVAAAAIAAKLGIGAAAGAGLEVLPDADLPDKDKDKAKGKGKAKGKSKGKGKAAPDTKKRGRLSRWFGKDKKPKPSRKLKAARKAASAGRWARYGATAWKAAATAANVAATVGKAGVVAAKAGAVAAKTGAVAAAGVVSAPVVLAAAGVAAVGVGTYYGWKHIQKHKAARHRFTAINAEFYGLTTPEVPDISKFELAVSKLKDFHPETIGKLISKHLKINVGNRQRESVAMIWFMGRFLLVFEIIRDILHRLFTKDIKNVDDLNDEQLKEYGGHLQAAMKDKPYEDLHLNEGILSSLTRKDSSGEISMPRPATEFDTEGYIMARSAMQAGADQAKRATGPRKAPPSAPVPTRIGSMPVDPVDKAAPVAGLIKQAGDTTTADGPVTDKLTAAGIPVSKTTPELPNANIVTKSDIIQEADATPTAAPAMTKSTPAGATGAASPVKTMTTSSIDTASKLSPILDNQLTVLRCISNTLSDIRDIQNVPKVEEKDNSQSVELIAAIYSLIDTMLPEEEEGLSATATPSSNANRRTRSSTPDSKTRGFNVGKAGVEF